MTDVEQFYRGYVGAILESAAMGSLYDGRPERPGERGLCPLSLERAALDCNAFLERAAEMVRTGRRADPFARAGADFWTTRHREGEGFRDGRYWSYGAGLALLGVARDFGPVDVMTGDDGQFVVVTWRELPPPSAQEQVQARRLARIMSDHER